MRVPAMIVLACLASACVATVDSDAPEQTAVAEEPVQISQYCTNACDIARRLGCQYIDGQCTAAGDGPDVVGVGAYVLSCDNALLAACGNVYAARLCGATCDTER